MITREDLDTVARVAEQLEKIWEVYAEANGYPRNCELDRYWADHLYDHGWISFVHPGRYDDDRYSMPVSYALLDHDERIKLNEQTKRERIEREAEAARQAREAQLERQQRAERTKLRELAKQYPDVIDELRQSGVLS